MEHKDENDYLSELLNDDSQGDFDNLLKEKMKGWTNPSDQQLLDNLKPTKTKHKLPPAEDVEVSSLATSKSNETVEQANSDESYVAPLAVEVSSNGDGNNKKPPVVAAATGGNGDDGNGGDEPPKSDPEFTRQIIEGKVQQHSVRGIKQGPWASQKIQTKVLPEQETLEKLGFVNIADIFGNTRKFFVRKYADDPMKVIAYINRLEGALVITRHMKDSGLTYVEELLKGKSDEEVKKAKDALSKVYQTKSAKTKPDGAVAKPRKPRTDGKPTEPKLDKEIKASYKGLIAPASEGGLGLTYEFLMDQLAKNNTLTDKAQRIMWLRWKFGKE